MKILKENIDIHNFFRNLRQPSLLMLDYDGTLAPFTIDRLQAYPYPGIVERLNRLKKIKKSHVVIISGRGISDLEKVLDGIEGIELWGSHGLERKFPDGRIENVQVDAMLNDQLELAAKICLEQLDEQQCEIKPFAVALHWRGVENPQTKTSIKSIRSSWEKICHDSDLEIQPFDGGIELRPKYRNKGDVVFELIQNQPHAGSIAYLGDDLTDEQAFEVLGDRGLKVLVRKEQRLTLADIQLIPPQELLDFLDQWIKFSEGDYEREP